MGGKKKFSNFALVSTTTAQQQVTNQKHTLVLLQIILIFQITVI